MAVNVEYNAHRIVDICAIEAEIRWVEYLSLNKLNCNCPLCKYETEIFV